MERRSATLCTASRRERDERLTEVRGRLALGRRDGPLLAELFALVRDAARCELGTPHHPNQILAGYWMVHGRIAELPTGEGKTLAATLPVCAAALAGIPVHVVSANDYLVERDARVLEPLFGALDLRVGSVVEVSAAAGDPDGRREAYRCDVTFATTRSLAFDYLRDVLVRRAGGGPLLLRGLCSAVIDEADSVLIDQASMPLVLAAPTVAGDEQRARRRALRLAGQLVHGRDFHVEASRRRAELTEAGRVRLETLAKPLGGAWAGPRRREGWVQQALLALWAYRRDRDYIVVDGAVQLVDPVTGRAARDRSWERGLQQLIETKEGCTPSQGRETLARISVQRFYQRYLHLAGTSGTVTEVARELRSTYGLATVVVPTRLPERRVDAGLRVYGEGRSKWAAVVERVRVLRAQGRPVLVGTGSVASAEHLGTLLGGCGIPHRVLSARQDADEARIVAEAGRAGRVTVSTQLAGRGTDIALDPAADQAGGLHVIATELGELDRVERQLLGRCARQGDPGSIERCFSLDDEALRDRVPAWLRERMRAAATGRPSGLVPRWWGKLLTRWVRSAEHNERRRQRRRLVALEEELEQLLAFSGPGE